MFPILLLVVAGVPVMLEVLSVELLLHCVEQMVKMLTYSVVVVFVALISMMMMVVMWRVMRLHCG